MEQPTSPGVKNAVNFFNNLQTNNASQKPCEAKVSRRVSGGLKSREFCNKLNETLNAIRDVKLQVISANKQVDEKNVLSHKSAVNKTINKRLVARIGEEYGETQKIHLLGGSSPISVSEYRRGNEQARILFARKNQIRTKVNNKAKTNVPLVNNYAISPNLYVHFQERASNKLHPTNDSNFIR